MIIVCSLKDLESVCNSVKKGYLISVIDPGFIPKTPKGIKKHLKLGFDDIVEIKKENLIHRDLSVSNYLNFLNDQILPNNEHIDQIIKFISTWNKIDPIIIHCWCGVSRSMAVAAYILCKMNIKQIESNIKYIRYIAAHANPNKLMLKMFEKSLKIEGQIIKAFNKYPYTVTYDCDTNFAPISIFKLNEIFKY